MDRSTQRRGDPNYWETLPVEGWRSLKTALVLFESMDGKIVKATFSPQWPERSSLEETMPEEETEDEYRTNLREAVKTRLEEEMDPSDEGFEARVQQELDEIGKEESRSWKEQELLPRINVFISPQTVLNCNLKGDWPRAKRNENIMIGWDGVVYSSQEEDRLTLWDEKAALSEFTASDAFKAISPFRFAGPRKLKLFGNVLEVFQRRYNKSISLLLQRYYPELRLPHARRHQILPSQQAKRLPRLRRSFSPPPARTAALRMEAAKRERPLPR
ncbi:hypothetical protein HFN63_33150 [Rhizobium leguminosarum]|uniref:hypothetical protein n=1 Tax=Rhizobium leguminosarum TaxID=384 RepID=UPI001C95D8C7|nr:hypothetical protein [Rhizobium leguminosarum]MBY5774875.1 hypothetical protein [Rhizobium leguminosarum]